MEPVANMANFEGKSIVICEDDLDMLESIAELLSDYGANVAKYSSATIALEHIKLNRPDLILSDITMPQMSGLEFLDALNSAGIEVPLIFLTGNADITTYRRGLVRGQFDFLTKPLVPSALIQAVQKALQFSHEAAVGTNGRLLEQIADSVENKS